MRLKRTLVIAVLALGSFAVVTGVGAAPAGAATPENLVSTAQYDQLWVGMSQQAVEAFLGKQLTNIRWGTTYWESGVETNYQLWEWSGSFGNCRQDTRFLFVDTDADGTTHPMQLVEWDQMQSPECDGIVK